MLAKANQQIEMNNQEMNRLKEESLVRNGRGADEYEDLPDFEEDEERKMRDIVEQFEVCFHLNKTSWWI